MFCAEVLQSKRIQTSFSSFQVLNTKQLCKSRIDLIFCIHSTKGGPVPVFLNSHIVISSCNSDQWWNKQCLTGFMSGEVDDRVLKQGERCMQFLVWELGD